MSEKYEKIGIVGAGISGIGAAKLALDLGAKVFISDGKPLGELEKELKNAGLLTAQTESKIEFEGGGQSERIYECGLIVVSPAVWRNSPIFTEAKKRSIEVIGEVEFAFRNSRCRWAAITGSTGKSTTSAMLNAVFDESEIAHCLCGNIGFSAAELAVKLPENGVAICEISSFQLETIDKFCPEVAVILNLYPNHLDRHASLEEYYGVKMTISKNMKRGLKITTSAQKLLEDWAKDGDPESFFYDKTSRSLLGKLSENVKLAGTHNLYNAAICVKIAEHFGISEDKILSGISKFRGLEHRMEFCAELNGVRFYNDSKSTTAESMLAAITGFAPKSVHLIAGGKDKGVPFEEHKEKIYETCAKVYAIGEASERIKKSWGEIVTDCENLKNAVEAAKKAAKPKDAVILSPACASFDQFKGFEDRGNKFREAVNG